MNQHSIPIDVHRKLGLDNIEPSGMEGDRPVADLASKEKEAAKEDPRIDSYMNMEPLICDLARLALAVSIIGEDLRESLRDGAKVYRKSTDLLNVCSSRLELLFTYIDDAKDGAQFLRERFYGEPV